MSLISVFILTYNEELHIERCIESVKKITNRIYVIDSFSSDRTVALAEQAGATVYQNDFIDHASQVNWALKCCNFNTTWVMRLDADEIISPALSDELNLILPDLDASISGLYVKRKVYFMNRWIKHGGYYPTWLLRVWRNGCATCEQRIMDEHINLLNGKVINLKSDIIDNNLNNLTWWTSKHNNYATKEAFETLNQIYQFKVMSDNIKPRVIGSQVSRKRWLKYKYAKLPLFIRPFIYFFYRYFLKFGFLDGVQGLIWHFLQGFWYRFLIDAKIYDIYRKSGKDKDEIFKVLIRDYGIKL